MEEGGGGGKGRQVGAICWRSPSAQTEVHCWRPKWNKPVPFSSSSPPVDKQPPGQTVGWPWGGGGGGGELERARRRQVVSDFSALGPEESRKQRKKQSCGGWEAPSFICPGQSSDREALPCSPQDKRWGGGGGGGVERRRLRTKSHLAAWVCLHARGTRNLLFHRWSCSPNSHQHQEPAEKLSSYLESSCATANLWWWIFFPMSQYILVPSQKNSWFLQADQTTEGRLRDQSPGRRVTKSKDDVYGGDTDPG